MEWLTPTLMGKKFVILLEVCFFSLLCTGLKFIVAGLHLEVDFSSILPALISSVIFLLGFILSGVLIDYKEAEKIPDELSVSIEVIFDQCSTTYKRTNSTHCLEFIEALRQFINELDEWFKKDVRTRLIMLKLNSFNGYILKMEELTQPVFINRLKEENSNLRRNLLRAHSIRRTEFLGSSHIISLISTLFVLLSLIVTKYGSVFESFLYVFGFSTIIIFIFKLIYDLDNPFDYYSFFSKFKDAVPLTSLYDLKKRINTELEILEGEQDHKLFSLVKNT